MLWAHVSLGFQDNNVNLLKSSYTSIATDCPIGGSAFIINNNENGILIPMNDKKALMAALKRCLTEKDFAAKISKNAGQIITDYDAEKVCREWENYLQKVYRGRDKK